MLKLSIGFSWDSFKGAIEAGWRHRVDIDSHSTRSRPSRRLMSMTSVMLLDRQLSDKMSTADPMPTSVLKQIINLVAQYLTDHRSVVSACCGNTNVKLFADDLKLSSIYDMSNTNGPLNLQQSVDQLVLWSNMWLLKINISKCHVLSIRNKTRTNTTCEYLLEGSHLSNVSITTDLGININSNLSFKSHLSTIITKSLQRVGIFFRGFSFWRFDIVRKHLSVTFVQQFNITQTFGILFINM